MSMKRLLVLAVLIGCAVSAFAACYYTPRCRVHRDIGTVRFANEERQEDGHTFFLYFCTADGGHYFWEECDY